MKKQLKRLSALLLAAVMALSLLPMSALAAEEGVFDVTDFGADPTGATESSTAVIAAIAEAKKLGKDVQKTIRFPKGEYHFYADYSEERELYVTNTIGIADGNGYSSELLNKRLGILLEDMENVTIDGGGSMFMYHGNITTLAALRCKNITFENFSFDHASPEVVDVTVESKVDNENAVIVYIPPCYDYEVSGASITWKGEEGPETGAPYWTGTNGLDHATGQTIDLMQSVTTRNGADPNDGNLFAGLTGITPVEGDDNRLKLTYSGALPHVGYSYQMRNETRKTPGMFFWECDGVTLRDINAHFMHGFGVVGQLSKNFTIERVNFAPRAGTGRTSAGFADFVQMSSVGGKVTIRDCEFSGPHDDPINIHGTYLLVDSVSDDKRTFTLKYKHFQTGGFPQFYPDDMVEFVDKMSLAPVVDGLHKIQSVVQPGEGSNDRNTTTITFENPIEGVQGGQVCAVENVTYTPEVEITGCRFSETPTRGVLVTTRKPVLIENNYFDRMGMAAIFISSDAKSWYESGPVNDVSIRNNTFIIQNRFGGDAGVDAGLLIKPTNPHDDPNHQIHKNITIENNTFYMGRDIHAIWAKSINGFTVKNNRFFRYEPNVSMTLAADNTTVAAGSTANTSLTGTGTKYTSKVFFLQACKNVTFENNTYDDGLNLGVGIGGDECKPTHHVVSTAADVTVVGDDLAVNGNNQANAVDNVLYFSSDPAVATVDASGVVTGVSEGTADIYAVNVSGERVFESNRLTFTVNGAGTTPPSKITISGIDTVNMGATATYSATVTPTGAVTWSVRDPSTGGAATCATISSSGVLTPSAPGAVEVVATVGNVSTGKLVTIPQGSTLNTEKWEVNRPVAGTWSVSDTNGGQVSIDAQGGNGDWEANNGGNNFFLTDAPEGDFEITVKLNNKTCGTSDCYCEAGLVVFKDDDNYVAMVRKNNRNNPRLSLGVEVTRAFNEAYKPDVGSDVVYLKITKNGNSYTGSFSADGSIWENTDPKDASISGYKIGFYATNSGGAHGSDHRFVFENFTLGGTAVPFVSVNTPPTATRAAVTAANGQLTLGYTYADDDSDAEGSSAILWYVSDAETGHYNLLPNQHGRTLPIFSALAGKYVKAVVAPKDAAGCYGAPVTTPAFHVPTTALGSGDSSLSALTATAGSGSAITFNEATHSYMMVDVPGDSLVVTPTTGDPNATVSLRYNHREVEGYTGGAKSLPLTPGLNQLEIKVTAPDERSISVYRVVATKSASNDAALSALTVNETNVLSGLVDHKGYLSIDWDSVTVSATPTDDKAAVFISVDRKPVENGAATTLADDRDAVVAKVRVVAEDGISEEIYTINLTKTDPTNADLQELSLRGVTLSPAFDPSVTAYTATSRCVVSLPLEAVANQAGATVSFETAAAQTGSETDAVREDIPLYSNIPNTLTIVVTSPDGLHTKAYTVAITAEPDLYLSDIDWVSAVAGYGDVHKDADTNGNKITLTDTDGTSGIPFDKGIGTHADSTIIYDLTGRNATTFSAKVGVSYVQQTADTDNYANVSFKVYLDNATQAAFDSGAMRKNTPYKEITLDMTGHTTLKLTATQPTNNYNAHANWAEAKLSASIPTFQGTPIVSATGVNMSKATASLAVGGTETLTATVTPSGATNKTVTWASTDEAIATVADGVVTAVSAGETTITATTGNGLIATCAVTVTDGDQPTPPSESGEPTDDPTHTDNPSPGPSVEPPPSKPAGNPPASGSSGGTVSVPTGDGSTVNMEVDRQTGAVIKTTTQTDGTVEVVKTTVDGSVTTTVTEPGGKQIQRAVNAARDVTITVTNPQGEVVAEVNLPAVAPEPKETFVDVPSGHWAEDAIHDMAGLGLVNGVGEQRFDMGTSMTRGALATILCRLSNGKAGSEVGFSDVAKDAWYADGISWAAKTGVIQGVMGNMFKPGDVVSREQLAVMLRRYATVMSMDVTTSSGALDAFTDRGKTGPWAVDGVAWCVEKGILQGKGGGVLDPTADVTRAEAAVILQRFMKLMREG